MFDTIIIGSGPAGMSAAIYLRRANKKVLLIEKEAPGGQMIRTDVIENYPGFKKIGGADLAYQMYEQVTELGAEFAYEEVIDLQKDKYFTVITNENKYETKTVLYATGNTNKLLGVPGERKLRGKGISFCAVCDGGLYKNKDVVVIGSSKAALEESLYLAGICSNVKIITSEALEEDAELLDLIKNKSNIEILDNTKVFEFIGKTELEEIKVYNTVTKESKLLKVSCAFLYLGLVPSSNSAQSLNVLDSEGYVEVNKDFETNIKGMFAAGDCVKKNLKQIVTAVSDGALAATSIIRYLQKNKD